MYEFIESTDNETYKGSENAVFLVTKNVKNEYNNRRILYFFP